MKVLIAGRADADTSMFKHGMTPEQVAQETHAAYQNGDAVHINGWTNKLLVSVSRLIAPSWIPRLIG